MTKKFALPFNTRFVRGGIAAILRWRKEDGDEAFYQTLRRDVWEAIIYDRLCRFNYHGDIRFGRRCYVT